MTKLERFLKENRIRPVDLYRAAEGVAPKTIDLIRKGRNTTLDSAKAVRNDRHDGRGPAGRARRSHSVHLAIARAVGHRSQHRSRDLDRSKRNHIPLFAISDCGVRRFDKSRGIESVDVTSGSINLAAGA